MKKIVAGLAALAMAASVFAADVTGQLKLGTKIFDSTTKTVLDTPASSGWDNNNTFFKISAAGDKSGAEFRLTNPEVFATGLNAPFYGLSLWIKPIDALKITIGDTAVNSNAFGTFAWWAKAIKFESDITKSEVTAIRCDLTLDNLSLIFLSANTPLLDFSKSGYAVLGDFWLEGSYNLGNAGTIQAIITKGADLNAYGIGGWGKTAGLAFAASYNKMPWQQTGFYADAIINLTTAFKFDEVTSQFGGQYCANGLALRLTNVLSYGDKYGTKKFDYGFAAQASYAIDAWTPYLKLVGNEIMDKKLTVDLGVTTTVGSCEIEAYIDLPLDFNKGSTFSVNIPLTFKMGL